MTLISFYDEPNFFMVIYGTNPFYTTYNTELNKKILETDYP
jgi:hypothetical protein